MNQRMNVSGNRLLDVQKVPSSPFPRPLQSSKNLLSTGEDLYRNSICYWNWMALWSNTGYQQDFLCGDPSNSTNTNWYRWCYNSEIIKRWPPGLDTASSLYQGTKICRRRRRRTRLSVLNKAMCHFPDTVIMIEGRGCVLGLFNLWIKPVQA